MMALRHLFTSAAAVALLTLLGSLSGCASAPRQTLSQSAQATGVDAIDLQKAGVKHRWTHTVGLAPGESIKSVWRVGDSVYVATNRSHLVCINASAGTRSWDLDLGASSHEIFRPVEVPGSNNLVVINQGQAAMLDKHSGKVLTIHSLGFSATTDPFVVDNTLCIGSGNYFYGLYLDPFLGHKWVTANPGDYFLARPALIGTSSLIIAGAEKGNIWRLSPDNGDWLWRDRKVNGFVVAPLVADARNVYVASLESRLYAFDVVSGAYQWDTRLEGKLNLAPVSANPSTVLCPTSGHGLYALAADKGDIKWFVPDVTHVGTVTADKAYASDSAGNVLAIQLDTGEVSAKFPVPDLFSVVSNKVDGLIFVAVRNGRIVAVEQTK